MEQIIDGVIEGDGKKILEELEMWGFSLGQIYGLGPLAILDPYKSYTGFVLKGNSIVPHADPEVAPGFWNFIEALRVLTASNHNIISSLHITANPVGDSLGPEIVYDRESGWSRVAVAYIKLPWGSQEMLEMMRPRIAEVLKAIGAELDDFQVY